MDIRYVCSEEELQTDSVLSAVAARAASLGITLAGTIQPVDPDVVRGHCDIVLGLLPDGERRGISIDLPPDVPGCRLDPEALEAAVAVVETRLPAAQALIVNKFGKQEAAGRGLVQAIGQACARDLPVLVGVAPQWRDAFLAFVENKAEPIAADEETVLAWLRQSCLAKAD